MTVSPPLRFLVVVLDGWVGVRSALLGSAWLQEEPAATAPAPEAPAAFARAEARPAPTARIAFAPASADVSAVPEEWQRITRVASLGFNRQRPVFVALQPARYEFAAPPAFVPPANDVDAALPAGPPMLATLTKEASRWSASAWLFGRRGGSGGLAPRGTLGGSQAGARAAYRLNGDASRPLAASFRASAPLGRLRGAEAAAGLDWKPLAKFPVHLLVERRQTLGDGGRSAFAAFAYGGVSDVGAGAFRIDAYGQAGVVGARSRDLFADGSARLSLPIAGVKVGAGVWAAAQPGVSRLDVGPQASVRLPGGVTVAVDWRLRVAGEAAPPSGPSVTLSTDF